MNCLNLCVTQCMTKDTEVIVNFIFNFKRTAVRLGEYDISTTDDGKHETIRVDHAVKHKQFRYGGGIHDIALVFMVEDVEFTGENFEVFCSFFSCCRISNPKNSLHK